MSTLLCTAPGRHGDLLWALPTCRAIAAVHGPVDLAISGKYGSLAPLLQQQPYLDRVLVLPDWDVQETAPMTPRMPPGVPVRYDLADIHTRWINLGYAQWPLQALPYEVYWQTRQDHPDLKVADLDLHTPWITVKGPGSPCELAVGFTDEHFELKYGIATLLGDLSTPLIALAAPGSRWDRERVPGTVPVFACDWVQAAKAIRNADAFLGCCSALHVLAVALGKVAVIMEPAEARHHPIFWPLGTDGPRVRLVRGTDGRPTFDARHVRETVETALKEIG